MKKTLFVLSLLMIAGGVNSQVSVGVLLIKTEDSRFDVKIKKDRTFIVGYRNNISTIIIRDFMERFDSAEYVRWFVDDKEVTAYYIDDKKYYAVRYETDGSLISIRKNYGATSLNPVVAEFIKQDLDASFMVDQVAEVIREKQTVYEISLQNQKHLCIVLLYKNNDDEKLIILDKKMLKKG